MTQSQYNKREAFYRLQEYMDQWSSGKITTIEYVARESVLKMEQYWEDLSDKDKKMALSVVEEVFNEFEEARKIKETHGDVTTNVSIDSQRVK